MLVDEKILISYGAVNEKFKAPELIFQEGGIPKFYYQLTSGRVKLNHIDRDGKEFIQTVLTAGQSVCELMLFIDEQYPVNAVVQTPVNVLKIPKMNFKKMLEDHPSISVDINKFLAERLYHKFIMVQNNASLNPEVRIEGILKYLKSFDENQTPHSFEILLTRQELASTTGLRVETVIRAIKKMEGKNMLKIENRKIFY